MSAMVLQFRAPRARYDARGIDPGSARAVIDRWLHVASPYGWFLVEQTAPRARASRRITPGRDPAAFTIGHRAVDNEGIYQLTPEFDGWALLSRRGELTVFETLLQALASICPTTIAA